MTVLQLRSGSSAEAQGLERHSRASATRNRRRFSQNICGNGLVRTFPVTGLIIGAVAAVLIAWRFQKHDTNEPKWRVTTSTLGLLLVTLSVFLFLTYRTYNALIGGEGNGNWTTLPSIRTANCVSLLGLLVSLTATRKMRWLLLAASCLMEFIWFSQGVSL